MLGVTVLVAVLLRLAVIEPFSVPSSAMMPTLNAGDRILVVKASVLVGPIRRGDIVVFRGPAISPCSTGSDGAQDLVKRVIGLPGETISSVGGTVEVDGRRLREPAGMPSPPARWGRHRSAAPPSRPVTISCWGTTGRTACDSRSFGPIPGSSIVGKVVAVLCARPPPYSFPLTRPRRRRGATVMAVALVPLLVACSSVGRADRGVALLPDAAAWSGSWAWSARCPFSPETASGCRKSGPVLGSAQLSGDEWNVGAGAPATGSVAMAVDAAGAVTMTGDLRRAPPCTGTSCLAPAADTWVRGYPSVLYGLNQCHARTSPPRSPALPLPVRLSALPSDLVGTTTYHSQAADVTYDVAYDMWLNDSGTKTPCQHRRHRRGHGVDRLRRGGPAARQPPA